MPADLGAVSLADLVVELVRRLERPAVVDRAPSPRYLEEAAVAKLYGLELRALVAARRRGELVGHRIGRRVLLAVVELDAWIAGRARAAAAPSSKVNPLDRAIASGRLRAVPGGRA